MDANDSIWAMEIRYFSHKLALSPSLFFFYPLVHEGLEPQT